MARKKESLSRSARDTSEEWSEPAGQGGSGGGFEEYDPDRPAIQSLLEVQALSAGVDTFGEDSDLLKARDELEERLGGVEAFSAFSEQAAEGEQFGLENIMGIGVGFKESAGHLTAEMAVKVFVEEKLPLHRLERSSAIPESIAGLPTDVEQVGEIHPLSYARKYPRAVPCGVSCGHQGVTSGTIGCLVELDNGRLAILSNNHILANENNARQGDPILQPGQGDRGRAPGDVIGVLERFIPIRFSGTNAVDAAAAWTASRFVDGRHVTYRMNPAPLQAQVGMSVMKNGRTTQSTMGVVTAVGVNQVHVPFRAGRASFNNQIFIRGVGGGAFSRGGDSGSVIVTAASKQPVALLFAGSASHTVANPISAVIRELGIRSFVGG